MRKYGGAVIPMQQNLNREKLSPVQYIVGNEEILVNMANVRARRRFDDEVIAFLDLVSKKLLANKAVRRFPDVVTLAFWLRKANMTALKKEYADKPGCHYLGRGMAFHIAPSNVPVNYMYSLVTGLLAGNANVVKIPSKDFDQIPLINAALTEALAETETMQPYIVLLRYGHEQSVNDALSEFADARIIWGGDNTIAEIRKSPLQARAVEIAFADRYSLAVIDAETYLAADNKKQVANDFYNDTYLTDQNACTSPRIVIWTGEKKAEAKELFWSKLHALLQGRYELQAVQAVNKLTSTYLAAAAFGNVKREELPDNLITRVTVAELNEHLMDLKDNSGYFFEYDCDDLNELAAICDNTHCQTLAYLGDSEAFNSVLALGLKGIDRVVPMGKTMDFEFLWDGYNLIEMLTRIIKVN